MHPLKLCIFSLSLSSFLGLFLYALVTEKPSVPIGSRPLVGITGISLRIGASSYNDRFQNKKKQKKKYAPVKVTANCLPPLHNFLHFFSLLPSLISEER